MIATSSNLLAEGGGEGAGGESSAIGIAQREATQRQQQIRNAQELLTDAELDRRDGNHGVAVEKYRTAFLSVPRVPAALTLRDAIFKRYQQGSIEYAEELINEAKWKEAETALARVMTDARDAGMAPGTISTELRTLLTRLRSDDYYNKAMSPQHLANVSTVEKLLSEAKGFADIGDLTKSQQSYQKVLKIDPYNTAARRGLETVDGLIMEYAEVARNQTRSSLLAKVSGGWEMPVPKKSTGAGFEATVVDAAGAQEAALQDKLNRISLPNVEFSNTPLQTVIEYLSQVVQELDTAEPDPTKRGINLVVDPQGAPNATTVLQSPITLKLTNAPLKAVLQYVSQQAGLKVRIDSFAVTLVPLSSADDTRLMTRTYDVPPDFISGGGAAAGAAGAPADPFANPAPDAGGTTLVKRLSAQEFLENNGITFPPGSLASFNASTSSLLVKNTPDNIALIEQMIIGAKEGGTKLVMVEFKLMETTDNILNELGFDWLLGQSNLPGSGSVFTSGGTPGNQGGTRNTGDFSFLNPNGSPVGQSPLTSGLRTGNVNSRLSIDDVINRNSPTLAGSGAAPGVLSVAGAFTDPQFQVVLRSLMQTKGVDLLCSASVITRPGERAIIKQIREFIHPTEYDPPEIPNQIGGTTTTIINGNQSASFTPGTTAATPATPAAFETRELGKVLEVEPTVGADNLTVDLNLIADFSDFSGFINYGSPIVGNDQILQGFTFFPPTFFVTPIQYVVTENRILMPVFDSIKETTNVSIYDGQTLVVGGLLGETVTKAQDKIPLIGDAPLVGQFFRSDIEQRFRRALVLFATVRILDPAGKPINDLTQMTQSSSGSQ
ncbi:MAG: hypothetical protein KDN20_26630 [Verrucomicrobiae bacterium]|nr:hypothetical protein [Verrucomicrobiae bacterium]